MKKVWYLSVPFIVLFIGLSFTFQNNDNEIFDGKDELLVSTMMEGFQQLHFHPLEIDDNFSKKLFNQYLERLDGGKRFLTQEDYDQLSAFENQLDEAVNEMNFEFFELSVQLIDNALKLSQQHYEEAIQQKFNFKEGGNIELDGDKRTFAKDEAALKQRWFDLMKYETMLRLHRAEKAQKDELEKPLDERKKDFKEKSFDELVEEARTETKDVFDKWFKRLNALKRSDRMDTYLNSIANLYDPHTGYFAPVEKQNFDIRMAGKLEGIGARLQSDGETTKVTEIITGGPAWKQGELEANDLITKVAQGDEEPVDVTNMLINEVISYIRGKKGTEVKLYVTKVDGSEKVISIIRDVVIIDEGYAKSLILNYKNEKIENVGYIYLPSFYADFRDPSGRQCAEDVAQEVKKLKEQKVNSIILDLRGNGGGSLRDVVDMSGLFIEEGPIVQVKDRIYKTRVLEDEDKRVLFDGHLIIMVDQFSASASEILAAAMQDYNRAVIIGSESTFGKGTVQRFVNLDKFVNGNQDKKPLGEVKMTIQKFYRINGGSTQLKGVESDIVLPNNYQNIDIGEKEYEYAMEWSQIEALEYKQNVRQVKNLDKLIANSKKRIAFNDQFKLINENADRLKTEREDTDYSLAYDEYVAERKQESEAAKKYEDIMKENIVGLEALNLKADIEVIENDEAKKERNDKWLKEIKKDIYLLEALMVMKDMQK